MGRPLDGGQRIAKHPRTTAPVTATSSTAPPVSTFRAPLQPSPQPPAQTAYQLSGFAALPAGAAWGTRALPAAAVAEQAALSSPPPPPPFAWSAFGAQHAHPTAAHDASTVPGSAADGAYPNGAHGDVPPLPLTDPRARLQCPADTSAALAELALTFAAAHVQQQSQSQSMSHISQHNLAISDPSHTQRPQHAVVAPYASLPPPSSYSSSATAAIARTDAVSLRETAASLHQPLYTPLPIRRRRTEPNAPSRNIGNHLLADIPIEELISVVLPLRNIKYSLDRVFRKYDKKQRVWHVVASRDIERAVAMELVALAQSIYGDDYDAVEQVRSRAERSPSLAKRIIREIEANVRCAFVSLSLSLSLSLASVRARPCVIVVPTRARAVSRAPCRRLLLLTCACARVCVCVCVSVCVCVQQTYHSQIVTEKWIMVDSNGYVVDAQHQCRYRARRSDCLTPARRLPTPVDDLDGSEFDRSVHAYVLCVSFFLFFSCCLLLLLICVDVGTGVVRVAVTWRPSYPTQSLAATCNASSA